MPGERWMLLPAAVTALLWASPAYAMHISEGILPAPWAAGWFLVATVFVGWGLRQVRRRSASRPVFKPMIGLVGAAVFLISCMPVPVPWVGTCSHPCGTGLAAVLIGPGPTIVVASMALLFQALFLAHGGLTTLGGNIFSMGVVGALSGYGAFLLVRRATGSALWGAFFAGLIGDWCTYAATSLEMGLALHGDASFRSLFMSLLAAFAPTQIPLGMAEGLVSMAAYRFIRARRPEMLAPGEGGAS